jgi:hypothetical protein
MDPVNMRPLGVGEILDLGIKIYRRRFGTLVRAVAVVVVPVSVLGAVVGLSAGMDTSDTNVDGGDAAAAIGGGLIAFILGFIASQVATAASFEIVSGDYLDQAPTWQESLRAARGRLGSLTWLSILYGLALGLGFIACVLPGIYLGVMFAVAVPALLFEDVRGRKALKRSRSLLRGRFWPALGVLLVSMILTSLVQGAIQGVLLGVLVSAGDSSVLQAFGDAVATSASSILTTPFSAAVTAVLYFDARVRKEGFDLELLARRIGLDAPPGTTSPWVEPTPRPVDQPPIWPPPPGWRPEG